ncbi:uncharacterized protein [Eurosta solidaginis]|uniref:uncharacterized protein n=1 Tax=Eurosta solidaginis TaxID=178769 RepID=UPI00353168DE
MQKISIAKMISGLLVIVCLVQASTASAVTSSPPELKCYVCENCAKITKRTPLEECDAEFFEKGSSTTEDPDDNDSTTPTALPTTTTETKTAHTTTDLNIKTTTTIGTTTEAVPTAPTVGPLNTTTAVTPINVGTIPPSVFELGQMNATNSSTTNPITTSSDAPKALPLVAEDYSYHCYSVQKSVNGSMSIERGCSRVSTMQSVCGQLKAMNMGVQISKCVPCSNSECNGSSALGVSLAAFLFALIAAALGRH